MTGLKYFGISNTGLSVCLKNNSWWRLHPVIQIKSSGLLVLLLVIVSRHPGNLVESNQQYAAMWGDRVTRKHRMKGRAAL